MEKTQKFNPLKEALTDQELREQEDRLYEAKERARLQLAHEKCKKESALLSEKWIGSGAWGE